jgi:hypothetical protein
VRFTHASPAARRSGAAVLAVLVLAGLAALPVFVSLVEATGAAAPDGPSLTDLSTAALGGVQRVLQRDGVVRLDPLLPAVGNETAHEIRGGHGVPACARPVPVESEPETLSPARRF